MTCVLIVNHSSRTSGAEESLLVLAAALDKKRHEVHVAAPKGPLHERLPAAGVSGHVLPLAWVKRTRRPLDLLRSAMGLRAGRRALSRLIGRLQPDVLHANSTVAQLYAAGLFGRQGLRVVWHIRDMQPLGALGRHLASRAHVAITISDAVRRFHGGTLSGAHDVRTVHNGVDIGRFRPTDRPAEVRAELGIPEDAVVFGCIGQAVGWKRHEDFIAAAERLSGRDWRFVLVRTDPFGHGEPLAPSVSEQVSVLPGYADMPALLSALDVLVQPSHNEPFGRTIIEAMAVGIPVIATDTGGPPEIVDHPRTGLIVPTGNVDALAAAMDRLGADADQRVEMGQAGRRRAEELFSAERHAGLIASVYAEALSMGTKP